MAFWCTDPQAPLLTPQQAAQTPFALVHQNDLPIFDQHRFSRKSPYFRLSHSGRPPEVTCPHRFCCQAFEPQTDIKQAGNLIQTCYPNTAVDADSIRMWLDRPVYHPGLLVWAAHVHSGEKVGLGIAKYDPVVPEVSLEWLQVHPRFQEKGLGKALIGELMRKAIDLADIMTVSWKVHHSNQLKRLYRGCGFEGSNMWWLLSE